jgi:hypothetical protein
LLTARIPTHIKIATMKIQLTVMTVVSLLAHGASAQSPSPKALTPVGVWRGTSVCLVRPSACHDEIVVYRIASTSAADSVTLDARKIVSGEEQEMGVLTCHFASANGSLACAIPQGTWRFWVRGDSLVGELRHPDNTKFRDVKTVRAP